MRKECERDAKGGAKGGAKGFSVRKESFHITFRRTFAHLSHGFCALSHNFRIIICTIFSILFCSCYTPWQTTVVTHSIATCCLIVSIGIASDDTIWPCWCQQQLLVQLSTMPSSLLLCNEAFCSCWNYFCGPPSGLAFPNTVESPPPPGMLKAPRKQLKRTTKNQKILVKY